MTPTTGLDWLLTGFTSRVDGVLHTVAVSGDGILVAASNELSPARADQLAAMVAGIVSLAQGLSAATDSGPVVRTIVEMGHSLLFVIALGEGDTLASLASLARYGCDVAQVAYEMSGLAGQVGAALTPSTR
ncbi:roadblock/LC7 domain-containing protein [Dactylosporangium sp. NPDC051541]|uniref:roadblock/LC7 domain-containing protein n=1 Tax=Dactylosporangium sp. NPDC051541 TaxID=3363977 RepID=UPI00378D4F50